MIFIYSVTLVFGLVVTICTLLRMQSLSSQKKIIEQSHESNSNEILTTIDHRLLIINNNLWLSRLDLLDKKVSLKLRLCGAVGGGALLLKFTGAWNLSMQELAMILLIVLVIIIVTPGILVNMGVKTRMKLLIDAIPYYIDLVAVCVQSGMTVESALRFVCDNFHEIDPNLASLMFMVVKKADVSGLQSGLEELYRSMEETEMRMFCSTLQQSVFYGTSLYENLLEISREIRELQLLDTEEKVGSLSAKMSIPLIVFIMFPIVVLIAAPGILRIMKSAVF